MADFSYEQLDNDSKKKLFFALEAKDAVSTRMKAVREELKNAIDGYKAAFGELEKFMIAKKYGQLSDVPLGYHIKLDETVKTVTKSTPINEKLVVDVVGNLFKQLNIPLDPRYVWQLLQAKRSQLHQKARSEAIERRSYKLHVKKDSKEIALDMQQAQQLELELLQKARADWADALAGKPSNQGRSATKGSSGMM
jgi:hypothetical protein